MKRLTNIINLGRFTNKETGKSYNVKRGRVKDRSVDVYFYLYMNKRVYISAAEFSNNYVESNKIA